MTITATIHTTAAALRPSLREPVTKTFKQSPRGLMAALDWLSETHRELVAAQGNLSYPRQALTIGDWEFTGDDLRDLRTSCTADEPDPWSRGPRRSRTENARLALAMIESQT